MEIQYASETLNHLDMSLDQQKLPQTQPQSNKHLTKGTLSITSILCKQFSIFTINFPLSIALFIYFWVLYIYQKTSDNLFGCVLYDCGAKFAPDVQHRGEFHRMIVSIPQFGGISQILIGVMTMQMYGYVAERQFGRIKFCIILFLAGYASNLMSYLIYPYHVTVGSYGIIYGVLVIYGVTILTQQLGMYKKLVIVIYCVIFGINFIPLIGINQIDIGCIFGGIISSVLLVMYFQQIKWKYGKIINYGALLLEVAYIVICTVLLFTVAVDDISAARFCT